MYCSCKVAKEAIAETKPTARVAGSMGPTGRFYNH